jgi:hypothetical protein
MGIVGIKHRKGSIFGLDLPCLDARGRKGGGVEED